MFFSLKTCQTTIPQTGGLGLLVCGDHDGLMRMRTKFFLPWLTSLLLLATPCLGADAAKTEVIPPPHELTMEESGQIANVVGRVLEQLHFRQAHLNDEMSATFLRNYLNALDYTHMILLQTDVDEFEKKFKHRLDDYVLKGDVAPAFEIFDRYLERLSAVQLLVQKLAPQEFDFSTGEEFQPDRNKLPWPADDLERAKLWKQRIKYELLAGRLTKEKPETTRDNISRRYTRMERTMKEFEKPDILQSYLTALARAYDPHSDYMSPAEAVNFDIHNIKLSLTGIGAQLIWKDGYTEIKELVPGGPADLGKELKPGDRIIAVAQGESEAVDVIDLRLDKVVNLIRGEKGTEVRLTLIPAADPEGRKIIRITRDEVKLREQFAKARVYDMPLDGGRSLRLGVVNLPQFYDGCADHVNTLIERLKKENIEGLVLDLRRNGGGILEEAVRLTGLFIRRGPVVQVKEPTPKPMVLMDRNPRQSYDGPLIVLVSKLSASASEIVAAALQDYGRAIIVGDQTTHGKGTVQQVLALENIISQKGFPNPGKLKLTVSKFYRIAGGTTQKEGVIPDVILPSLFDYMDIGEASLENCLPANKIKPADYTAVANLLPFLAPLKDSSHARVMKEQEFAYLQEDIQQVKRRQENKLVSLNEQKRKDEIDQNKARAESRKKERAARPPSLAKVYDLDLKSVEDNLPLALVEPRAVEARKTLAGGVAIKSDSANLAAGTNPKVESGKEGDSGDPEADILDLDKEPEHDAHLDEGLHILIDYIRLLAQQGTVASAAPGN